MTFYSDLGLSPSATPAEIKRAYRKAAQKHHPDREGGDKAKFQALSRAYATLGDAEKRAHYDQTGEAASADDDPDAQVRRELITLFLSLVEKQPEANFRQEMERGIKEGIRLQETNIQALRQRIKKYEKAKKALVKKGTEGEGFLELGLLATINTCLSQIKQVEGQISLGKRMLKLLGEEYDYNRPLAPQQGTAPLDPFNSFFQSQGWTR